MKIKILLFANLVLIGSAIVLYINRSTGSHVAPVAAPPPAAVPIPPETPPPDDEAATNSQGESNNPVKPADQPSQ